MAQTGFHVMAKPVGPICNLDCEYCYYLDKERLYPHGEDFRMAETTLERYIQEYISAQPGPEVTFAWQGGEPTLIGLDFFHRVVELQQHHLPPGWTCLNTMQTNGILLDEEWCRFLKDHSFLVGISIDGPEELHDIYRYDKGRRPTHARVVHGLKLLQAHGVDYNVLCVVNAANVQHPLEVYNYLKGRGVQWLQFIPLVEKAADGMSPRTVPAEAYGRFLAAIFDVWVRNDVGQVFVQIFEECLRVWAGLPANLCIFSPTCGKALALEHNGDLFSCDHFVDAAHYLGNIQTAGLIQLVESAEQAQFGQDKQATLPRYCRECDVRFICNGGCPKNRLMVTPDGEAGLNYLCAGYKHFFHHVVPFAQRMVELVRQGRPVTVIMQEMAAADTALWAKAGRNHRCPCGSGKKYKYCCMHEREAATRQR